MWTLNCDTNENIYETESESWTYRTDWWLPRGMGLQDGWSGTLGLADAD